GSGSAALRTSRRQFPSCEGLGWVHGPNARHQSLANESCFKSIRGDWRNSRKAVPSCIGADPKICTRITRIHANESCFKSIRVDSRNSRKGVPTPHSQLSRTLHAAHPNEAQSEP